MRRKAYDMIREVKPIIAGSMAVGLTLAFVAGCGGVTRGHDNGQPTDASDSGGRGVGGGDPGGAFDGRGGTVPAAGGVPTYPTKEAGVSCRETDDTVHIDVSLNGSVGDAGLPVGDTGQSLTGTIASVTRGTFTLTQCAFENGHCVVFGVGTTWTITIDAPGLDLQNVMYAGNLAAVHYVRRALGAAGGAVARETRDILVMDPFNGDADAGFGPASILVAADDGGGTLGEAPYQVSFTPTPCFDSGGTCTGQPPSASVRQDFGLMFVAEGVTTTVQMGETALWNVPDRETLLAVRNLRSFATNSCAGTSSSTRAFWVSSTSDCPRCL